MSIHSPRLRLILGVLGLTLFAPLPAGANTQEPSLGPIRPTFGAAGDAYRQADCDRTKTADCVALATILNTDQVFTDATMTPMKIGMPNAKGWAVVRRMTRPSLIRRRLRQVLLSYPDRFPAICARIKGFASLYKEDVRNSQGSFIVGLLQTAVLMDVKSRGHCLSEVLAALPHTPDADDQVEIAHDFCKDSQWATSACKRIAR